MQNEFYNQAAVEWARRNLSRPLKIKLYNVLRLKIFTSILLFIPSLILIMLFIPLKLRGGTEAGWWGIPVCGAALLFPPTLMLIAWLAPFLVTQWKCIKYLDAHRVMTLSGQNFLWEKLYYVDHVSTWIIRTGTRRNKQIKDDQLELVLENGKAIIPSYIHHHREQIWNLINSIPVQNRDDGEIRKIEPRIIQNTAQQAEKSPTWDEILAMMKSLPPPESKGKPKG